MKNRMLNRDKQADGLSMAGRVIKLVTVGLISISLASTPALAQEGPREYAKRIHDRLAGVPPTDNILNLMEGEVSGQTGTPLDAAYRAMDNPNFYNVTLKNFAAPWTNREGNVFVPLNDYIATVIGMIRDDKPFNTLFSADLVYIGPGSLPPYSNDNNNHYEEMERQGIDMSDDQVLVERSQSFMNGLPLEAIAGVWTTRAAAKAFFVAGTNRAQFRFTMVNHLCNDMEQVHDVKLSPDRIRQDVSRSPGGDSRLFLNNCVGCHTGMDPMAQAFAYYNYDDAAGAIEYTAGNVQPKYFNNDLNFPPGYATPDDHWTNYWRTGQNRYLGFNGPGNGDDNGAKSLGVELSNSDAFAGCQVKKVFQAVCMREPETTADHTKIDEILGGFAASGFQMKRVFADAAEYCAGQ